MAEFIQDTLLVLSLALAVPASVLLLQVLAALSSEEVAPLCSASAEALEPTVTVLVPAHDEAKCIAKTLASIFGELKVTDRILVVADNCSDDTARIARKAEAVVIERRDPKRLGKGYALDAGVRAIEASGAPPQVVVIVDADCVVEPGAIGRIAALAVATRRPVQAAYCMVAPANPTFRQRLSAFAWLLRNTVRPLGARRLGWPCQLMGTGMAFPWEVIRAAPLASGHLVEDLQLGAALARAGTPPLFCPDAVVTSTFPVDNATATVQRTRWEHGHLSLIFTAAPGLFTAGIASGRWTLVGMALDLAVPPLALLVFALGAVASVAWTLALFDGSLWAASVALAALMATVGAVVLAAARFGRGIVSMHDLLRAPQYIATKLPIYGRWLRKREAKWIRTRR